MNLEDITFLGEYYGRWEDYKKVIGKGAMGTAYIVDDFYVDKVTKIGQVEFPENISGDLKYLGEGQITIGNQRIDISGVELIFLHAVSEYDVLQKIRGCRNVVQIYPYFSIGSPLFGIDDNSLYSIVRTSYVEGNTIETTGSLGKNLTLKEIAQITIDIADALEDLGNLDVVHHDIKPENIIYDKERKKATLIDFGLAYSNSKLKSEFLTSNLQRLLEKREKMERGITYGTPPFFSPEHINEKKITPQSDVFSFGLSLVDLLSRISIGSELRECSEYMKMYEELDRKGELIEDLSYFMNDSKFDCTLLEGIESALHEDPKQRDIAFLRDSARNYLKPSWGQRIISKLF